MGSSHFFAFLRRMRFIKRWGLMRNTMEENIQEHTAEVAWIARHLGVMRNTYYGGSVDVNRLAVLALYHEVSEIFTGDMPTPIKYFDEKMRELYRHVEERAQKKLLHTLPQELQGFYEDVLVHSEQDPDWALVKAADTLSAYMKCQSELAAGNLEFRDAERRILEKLKQNQLPEVQRFIEVYVPSLALTLDEMQYSMEEA